MGTCCSSQSSPDAFEVEAWQGESGSAAHSLPAASHTGDAMTVPYPPRLTVAVAVAVAVIVVVVVVVVLVVLVVVVFVGC